jgi:hypothetical protein
MKRSVGIAAGALVLLCMCLAIASPSKRASVTPTPRIEIFSPSEGAITVVTRTPQPSATVAYTSTPTNVQAPSPTNTRLALQPTATPRVIGVRYVSADGDGVFIRRTKNMDDKIRVWPDGTAIDLLAVDTDWCQVRDPDGVVGYIPTLYLATAKPTALPVRVATIPLAPPTHPPAATATAQPEWMAKCRGSVRSICCDGWGSPSTGQGTCSGHGGVCHSCP